MDFLGRGRSSQEPNHLHGVMSSFPPPSSTFVCFPILVFGLLFVSFHVRLYLIMVLLFLCQQFILLPCHLIMCCVNRVLLCCRSLWMTDLSGLLTCVDVCSFIGITAQVYTLHWGLWRLFSAGFTSADISVFLSVSDWPCQSLCQSCSISFPLHLSLVHKVTLFAPLPLLLSFTLFILNSLCVSLFFVNLHCLFSISRVLSAQHHFIL